MMYKTADARKRREGFADAEAAENTSSWDALKGICGTYKKEKRKV